jgi:hypothetical protein
MRNLVNRSHRDTGCFEEGLSFDPEDLKVIGLQISINGEDRLHLGLLILDCMKE